jgi:UDP-N-acetylmuramyl pentapeptide phosphotransferase/UDP-N-acetylglucosamine-1-phosphate transferase
VPFLIAAALSLVGTAALISVAPRIGLVDRPGSLKLHERPMPYAGAALAVGALAGGLGGVAAGSRWWVALGALIALAGGLWDDLRPQSPWVRLPVQVGAGVCLVAGGLTLEPLGAWGPAVLVLATAACCNAVNMMDGQDGLAPGLGAIAGLGLAGVAAVSGTSSTPGLAVAGAGLGFLVWNRPPARAFLGDGGAYALGVLLVAAATTAAADWPALLGVVLCLGMFVAELTSTVLRRLLAASPALRGDRDHTYDRLADVLGSRPLSTLVLSGLAATLALLAQPVARLQIPLAAILTIGVGIVLAVGLMIMAGRPTSLREESR